MSELAARQAFTYPIKRFFRIKEELEKTVNDVWVIREHCSMVVAHRGDLTGDVYGLSYCGLEEAGKLLAEFERKVVEYREARKELEQVLSTADFEFIADTYDSIDHHRTCIEKWFSEIQQFFNHTHEYYRQYPAPKPQKVSGLQNLIMLASYASLGYVAYHFIF